MNDKQTAFTMAHIRQQTEMDSLRMKFSHHAGKIEQMTEQSYITPVEVRFMEFKAVMDIIDTAQQLGLVAKTDVYNKQVQGL